MDRRGRSFRIFRKFRKFRFVWWAAAALAAGGCATVPRGGRGAGGDRAVLAAFWEAAGVPAEEGELDEVLGGGGTPAMRRMAAKRGLALADVRADEAALVAALGKAASLVVSLPPGEDGKGWRMGIPVGGAEGRVEFWTGGAETEWREVGEFVAEQDAWGRRALAAFKPGRRVPEGRDWLLAEGAAWMSAGKWKKAEGAYRGASAGDGPGDARGAAGLGDALFREGKGEAADGAYAQALELEPGNPRFLNNRAYAMATGGGDPETAVALAEKACAARPRNPRYLETAAMALMSAGRAEEAAGRLERAWGLAARETPEARRAILEGLARAWLAAGRESLAWQAWEARAREFPEEAVPEDLLEAWPFLKERGGRPGRLGR